jgi:hypothetical protein
MTIESTWAWRPHEWGFPVSLSLATLSLATSITAGVIDETAMRVRSDLEALRRRLDEWKRRLFAAAEDYGGLRDYGDERAKIEFGHHGQWDVRTEHCPVREDVSAQWPALRASSPNLHGPCRISMIMLGYRGPRHSRTVQFRDGFTRARLNGISISNNRNGC